MPPRALLATAVAAAAVTAAAAAAAPTYPWQDPTLPVPARVANLISLLTVPEKVALLNAESPAIDRIKLPAYSFAHECERGDSGARSATSFPSGVALGSTFNRSLVYAVAHATAIEARAGADTTPGVGASCFGPVVNLVRDGRWGRTNEMIGGEDTTLGAELGVAFTRGIQAGSLPASPYRMVNTIAKHLSAYSGPEGYCGGVSFATQSRFSFTAAMDERTWREFYLPPWRAMAGAGVTGFMSSYQSVALEGVDPPGGVPDSASRRLLTDTLRGEWNWTGYILSDAGAVAFVGTVDWNGTAIGHGFAPNASAAAAAALTAGVDLELVCCQLPAVYGSLVDSVARGAVPEGALDAALGRTLPYRFELGTLDPPGMCPYANLTAANVSAPWMVELAAAAAGQAVVLLKNEGPTLPLAPGALAGRTIAVVGPSANDTLAQQGGYVTQHPAFIRTPLEGLAAAFPLSAVAFDPGCDDGVPCLAPNVSRAAAAAAAADVTVVVLGTTAYNPPPPYGCVAGNNAVEAEGWDRQNASLPGAQLALLQGVVAAAGGRPVVLVLVNAGMLDVAWAAAPGSGVGAILHAPFLGMTAGAAIAAAVAGAVNPAGRLTATWYTAEGLAAIGDITDYRMRPDPATGYPGRTYRYTTAPVQFPFGFGLSYASFAYSGLAVSPPAPGPCDTVAVTVTVANTGAVDGDEVVQLYVSLPGASVPSPARALADFARVAVPAGGAVNVTLAVAPARNAVLREGDLAEVVEPGARVLWVGGASSPGFAPGVGGGYAVAGPTTPVSACGA